jgi:hypothetical protein
LTIFTWADLFDGIAYLILESEMKKTIAMLCLALGFMVLESNQASAFYCEARGTTGASGWGRSSNPGQARRIALRECAIRTPRRAVCRIMFCNR